MLTALGTGIVGMATEGYVPKTGTDAPLRMLDRINEWEKLYDSQNREYRQLKLRALMGQQEGEQQAANMEASAAGQAYNLAQKQYDALLGYMWKAQQEKQKRAEDLRDKKEIEKIRGENNLKVARTRAAASAPRLRVFCRPDMALSCRSCSGVSSGSELFIIQIVIHDLLVGETGFAHLFGLSCFKQIQCFGGVWPGNIAFRLPEQHRRKPLAGTGKSALRERP